jgi:transposase
MNEAIDINKKFLQDYVDKGMSSYQIAKVFSCSPNKVRRLLRKYNMKTVYKRAGEEVGPLDDKRLSPFRRVFAQSKHNAKCRVRKKEFTITLEYVADLWEEQGGKCAISGLKMNDPRNWTDAHQRRKNGPLNGSLDRINSNYGYVEGNVQWTCTFANYAKNNYDNNEIKKIFNKLRKGAK